MCAMRALVLLFTASIAFDGTAGDPHDLTREEIRDARKIYVAKCAKCHRFYEPKDYSEADWQMWMRKMNKASKLTEEQARLLTKYLDFYRAGRLPGRPQDKP